MPTARLILFVLGVLGVWFGSDAIAQEQPPPPALDGTGVEVIGWLISEFGWPGLGVWLAWQLRGYLAAARGWQGVPIQMNTPLVIEISPSTLAKFVARTQQKPADPDATTSGDEPPRRERRP